ncbi:MAG: PorP/SprF family type IX secretion system membrane protein [Rufibacter sp.]
MKIKHLVVAGLLLMTGTYAQAQIIPHRMVLPRLYHQNYFYLNPAYAGANNSRELGLNAHLNSLGSSSTSSAPLSVIAHYQGSVTDTVSNGVGIVAVYDQFGPFWLGKLGLAYSKRFRLGEESSIAIGTQVAAKYLNVDLAEKSRLENTEPMVGHDNDLRPDVDMGLWLNIKNFYTGATFASLLSPNYNLQETAEREDIREVFAMAGYKFEIGEDISLTPSVFFDKPLKGGVLGKQYSAQATVKFLTLGATYRNGGRFAAENAPWSLNAGINLKENLQIMAAYDLTKEVDGKKPASQVEASLRIRL